VDPVANRLIVYPLSIPLRHRVAHAASQRAITDPVVVGVELRNGTLGHGETLPREYVTGETVESVLSAIEAVFVPAVLAFHPHSFPEALEAIEGLPWVDSTGRSVAAARAAVELALLDASLQFYGRDFDAVVQWMGLAGFGSPGSIDRLRFSGVLACDDTAKTLRQLRRMYWGGLRHFKLKVGTEGDRERIERVVHYLRRPLARGKASLRVDANGTWTVEQLVEWLSATAHLSIDAIEQPLPRGQESELPRLAVGQSAAPHPECPRGDDAPSSVASSPAGRCFVHDESLCTIEDARRLLDLGVADIFNIRISKCGGLLPSLRLAALARRENVDIQLGCMVGETSILSAAGLRFLQVCPGVRWAEGCFGSFLLADDIVAKPLRFGYGGRPPRLPSLPGLGVRVDTDRLRLLSSHLSTVFNL